jgi:hypothetical protein
METNANQLQQFLQAVDGMKEAAMGCDDAFAHLDAYVDAVISGKDAQALFPKVAEHLANCKACAEEFELLKLAVSALE